MPKDLLVVADSVTKGDYYKAGLEFIGWQLTVIDKESAGLAITADRHFAIMIIDIGMPVKNEAELIRKIREEENPHITPIIVFAQDDITERQDIFYQAGVNVYFTKLLSPAELRQLVFLMAMGEEEQLWI